MKHYDIKSPRNSHAPSVSATQGNQTTGRRNTNQSVTATRTGQLTGSIEKIDHHRTKKYLRQMKNLIRKIESWLFDIEYYLRFSKNDRLFALHGILLKFLYRKVQKCFLIGTMSYKNLLKEILFPIIKK